MKRLITRLARLFRSSSRHSNPRQISLECLMDPNHGLQQVVKVSDELPAILFLKCGCWRTRCTTLVTDEGTPSETRTKCQELDRSLRVLLGA